MLATKKIKEEADSSEKESDSKENSIEPYTVDKILDKKIVKGKVIYKVKWKNYPLSQCTWEPIENFIDKSVVNDFEKQLKTKPEKRRPGRPPKKKPPIVKEENEEEESSDNKEESSDSTNKEKSSESSSSDKAKSSESQSSSSEKKSSEESNSENKSSAESSSDKEKSSEESNSEKKSSEESNSEKKSSESASSSIKNILEMKKKKIGNIKNDIPEKIISSKQNVDVPSDLCCFVEWKVRKDGTKPDNSYVKNSEIKEKFPYVLLDYYEEQIMLSSKKRKRTYSVDSN